MKSDPASSNTSPLLKTLREIVLSQLEREDFDVEKFAELAGMSRSDLYRKIKKHSGKSVTEFVRDIRLRKSLEYLQEAQLTASEVSYKVGFSSPTYFSKCFKEKYGFTPGEAAYNEDKINTLLGGNADIEKQQENPSTLRNPVILILAAVGLIFISWFFINNTKAEAVNAVEEHVEEHTAEIENETKQPNFGVLTIFNITKDSLSNQLSLGITHELIQRFNNDPTLRKIIPYASSEGLNDSSSDPIKMAKKFKLDEAIHGTLLRVGNTFKINLYHSEIRSEKIIWKKEFIEKWDSNNPFQIQEKIAEETAISLGRNVPSYPDINNPGLSSSEMAHRYFYQGITEANRNTKEGWENSIEYFNLAIEQDSTFINAYLNLSNAWQLGGIIHAYISQDSAWNKSKEILNKVLTMEPNNQYALYTLRDGYFYYELIIDEPIPNMSGISTEEYIAFNTDYATKTGYYEIADQGHYYYQKRDPKNGLVYALMAINKYFMNERGVALEIIDDNFPIYKNDLNFLRESSKCYYFLGEYRRMEEAVLLFFKTSPEERPPIMRWLRAIVADKNGDQEEVKKQLNALHKSFENEESGSPAWFIALYHAYNQDETKTLDWLERSYEAKEVEMTWLAQEPDLEFVGSHERYIALLDSMGFSQSARRHVK